MIYEALTTHPPHTLGEKKNQLFFDFHLRVGGKIPELFCKPSWKDAYIKRVGSSELGSSKGKSHTSNCF